MGGHGGLNILPQKRWNVYNFDNREKVKQDEEAAAKEEQLKREQSSKRDAEFRLEQLRQARGLAFTSRTKQSEPEPEPESELEPQKSKHINLFEGIRIFDPVGIEAKEGDEKRKGFKRMKKEAPLPKAAVLPEDEKYRLGYGVAGKGVKLPWYMEKRDDDNASGENDDGDEMCVGGCSKSSSGKKTLAELREERLKRERREKERERALVEKGRPGQVGGMKDRGHYWRDRYN